MSSHFNPRSPHGERPQTKRKGKKSKQHFNPRSPHGERREPCRVLLSSGVISTHAPRTGSDGFHAVQHAHRLEFQPTLPARGATASTPSSTPTASNFNPRSPHGERRHQRPHQQPEDRDFNPRSPHGERPTSGRTSRRRTEISTHAPRTGSDAQVCRGTISTGGFQPTLPARGATQVAHHMGRNAKFQPTLPARGATRTLQDVVQAAQFQPTLPARGATSRQLDSTALCARFQPTLPARGAT